MLKMFYDRETQMSILNQRNIISIIIFYVWFCKSGLIDNSDMDKLLICCSINSSVRLGFADTYDHSMYVNCVLISSTDTFGWHNNCFQSQIISVCAFT